MALSPAVRRRLEDVLDGARRAGYLGPGPVVGHVDHALGFAAAAVDTPARAVDLGSGGGVPGLVLALWWPASRWDLLDANARRVAFLAEASRTLGVADRVAAVHERAEAFGRVPTHRGRYDLVTARSFGPPAVVAECAAPLLRVGGRLVVSEPPVPDPDRWPATGLAAVGLSAEPVPSAGHDEGPRYQVMVATGTCPQRFPRRVGIPVKRPLF
jgi:16S rRNA (guanine527-N7)-methyltransferase